MKRRDFLKQSGTGLLLTAGALAGCGRETLLHPSRIEQRAGVYYDSYAMALYMDGGLGPKTGIIRAQQLIELEDFEMEFWHGHGGTNHRYVVTAENLSEMKDKKVILETDVVASHSHKLFVDFSDERWRVPNSKPIMVP